MVFDVKFYVVLDAGVSKILEEDFGPRFGANALGIRNRVEQYIFRTRGRRSVIENDRYSHRMLTRRPVEIDDGLPRDFAVRNLDGNVFECSQASRAPIDLYDFRMPVFDDQPIAMNKRFACLQSDAGNDVPTYQLQ